jgi:hypothetical protein
LQEVGVWGHGSSILRNFVPSLINQEPELRGPSSGAEQQQPREQGGPLKEMHPIAPQRRPNSPCFMHLFRLVLTRSRPPEFPKANQFLAHLALLVGPEALSRPATAQKSLGRGRPPPLRPPPCAAARRPDWATPSPTPPRGGGLAAPPHMGGGFNCHYSD